MKSLYRALFSIFFLRTFLPPFFVWACKICVSSASRVGGQHILCKGKERRATNERKQRNILCGKKTTHTHTQTHTHTHTHTHTQGRKHILCGKKTRKESRETLCGNACLSPVPRTKDGNFQNLWKLDFSEFMKMHACRQSHGTPKSVWPCSHPCYISNTLATH